MKTEKKQKETKSKFDLQKMSVAQLDNLHLINGGDNNISVNGDDPLTITDKDKGGSTRDCGVSIIKHL
ncbi:hypothetical protein K5V07_00130 [Flavobacterium sp. CHNK8]|uniref:hypothetical protein n=1 Tax=Flavobacterium sp. CHNK8 TaxID=2871165 RepID=UPI001C8EDA4D|nr:hypothetical protein [Flavobacterium sp. CHNK8]QZK88980.1 hypothetical protein K5V07_00130 [Flavobacterium sp. CHNK8]